MRIHVMFAVLLIPSVVHGEALRVSLQEAIGEALAGNHLLKAAIHQRAGAAREVAISRSRYFPQVSLEESFTAGNSPTRVFMMKLDQGRFKQGDFAIDSLNHPSSHNDFVTSLSLEQLLFDLSVVRGVEAAEQADRGWEFKLESQRQDTALDVYTACLEVQKTKAMVAVADQAVMSAREHLRLARVRNESGMGLKSDELRAATHLAEMEQQEISARNDVRLAQLRLGRLLGRKAGEAVEISEELRALPVIGESGMLSGIALEIRQDLKEVENRVILSEVGVREAKAAWFPTAHASAAFRMNDRDLPFGRDNDSWQVGVNLRWEIFDGMRRGNAVAVAEAERLAAEETREHYRNEVLYQVTEQELRREEAGQRLAVARQALQQAEEALRLVVLRFENSLATMADLLDAQTALTRSRAMVVENETSFAQASARLHAAAGTFLKEVVK